MEHEIIDQLNIQGILDGSAILNICYNYFCLFDHTHTNIRRGVV